MTRVTQPAGSNLCGQAVVAMLAGITLEQAIALTGTRGRTRFGHIERALAAQGLRCERTSLYRPAPGGAHRRGFGKVRTKRDGRWSHWYAFDQTGQIFDSWYDDAPRDWPAGWRIICEYLVAAA